MVGSGWGDGLGGEAGIWVVCRVEGCCGVGWGWVVWDEVGLKRLRSLRPRSGIVFFLGNLEEGG